MDIKLLFFQARMATHLLLWCMWSFSLCQNTDAAENRQTQNSKKVYQCHYVDHQIIIDGSIQNDEWNDADWTEYFVDIEGSSKPPPFYGTRVKMLWDSSYLYIAAHLEEDHLWGYVTKKNTPIYQFGNDFEVFIDPDRDHHNYYELELNVLNTIWELTLEKPYRNGGPAIDPTNLPGLLTAVSNVGSVNDPSDIDEYWTVEIAIPFADLHNYRKPNPPVSSKSRPDVGDRWGINFSRVHWDHQVEGMKYQQVPDRPEYNWVWSPQGEINMHAPENWGVLVFVKGVEIPLDSNIETVRSLMMAFYKSQQTFFEIKGIYARSIDELDIGMEVPSCVEQVTIVEGGKKFVIESVMRDEDGVIHKFVVDETSQLIVK